jgi:DNA end-binding protein Ku
MKIMWKGAISFGLVTIHVRVFLATEERSVSFHQLHDRDHGRITYRRFCTECGQEVDVAHIVRGHEIERDQYVVLTAAELDAVPVASTHTIDIAQFVDLREIDPVYFKRSYYLVPDAVGSKAYRLLLEAMRQGERVAIAKVSFRDKEHLAAVRAHDEVLVLETMYWPDEIRAPEFAELTSDAAFRPQELEMARSLIEQLTETWDPTAYRDEYRDVLLTLIAQKAAGEEIVTPAVAEPAPVVDLLAALRASVNAAKERKAG